jgi:uncharacterized protein (DUF362 family)
MAHVALIAGELRRNAVRDAVQGLGDVFRDRVKSAKSILIKPDVGHYELQLAATHVDALRGVLDALRSITDTPVVIADAGHYGTLSGFRHFGYERLPEEYVQVNLRDLQESETVEQQLETLQGMMTVRRAKEALHADVKISLAMLKTHRQYGACLSVANWAEGTWIVPPRQTLAGRVFTRAPWLAANGSAGAHTLLRRLYVYAPADVGILDGFLGMEGDGPTDGTAIHVGVAVASMDPVAADAVGATLMGIDPRALVYLDALARDGQGIIDVAKMDVPLQTLRDRSRIFQLPFEQRSLRN